MTQKIAAPFLTNAVWAPTGYGTQAAQLTPRLNADGHAFAIAANYGLQAMMTEYQGITHYPMGLEQWSNDTIEPIFKDWTRQFPDHKPMAWVLFDAWPLKGPQWDRLDTAIWTMVDHIPVPPAVLTFLQKPNVTPIAASQFATEQIQRAGVDAIYCPMAIDCEVYQPTELWTPQGGEPKSGSRLMGWDDDGADWFQIGIFNANKGLPGRKAWGENLLAAAIFMADHPDARLYIHSERHGNHGGHNLDALLKAVGIDESRVKFVNQWAQHMTIPNEAMAALYTATDVLLAPTYGEGFGLTALEAAACGTVAIVNDFTSQPELLGEGWLTEGQPWYNGAQLAWWNIPNVQSIVDCLEQAYARGKGRSDKQREHALQYDADAVFDRYWRPALDRLGGDRSQAVDPVPVDVPPTWDNGIMGAPLVALYIPAYRRPELDRLLSSIATQASDQIEVILSDDDPRGTGWPRLRTHLVDAPCRVEYHRNTTNLGAEANKMRGYRMGTAPWVWVLGDDDAILPGGINAVLSAIAADDADRLILLTAKAPKAAAGLSGTPAEIAAADPGLLIAATCTSANVVRRSAMDVDTGLEHGWTMYGHSFADAGIRRLRVLPDPVIYVGPDHAGEYAKQHGFDGDIGAIWTDLLRRYGIDEPGPQHLSWNFVSAESGG